MFAPDTWQSFQKCNSTIKIEFAMEQLETAESFPILECGPGWTLTPYFLEQKQAGPSNYMKSRKFASVENAIPQSKPHLR